MNWGELTPGERNEAIGRHVLGLSEIGHEIVSMTDDMKSYCRRCGVRVGYDPSGPYYQIAWDGPIMCSVWPSYTTDVNEAMKVVDYLTVLGYRDRHGYQLYFKLLFAWRLDRLEAVASFDWKETGDRHPLYQGVAPTIPEAICIAALRVVGQEVCQ